MSSLLFTILKNKEKFKEAVLKGNIRGGNKKLHGADHVDLETALFEWFSQKQACGVAISGPILKTKAHELALKLNIEGFQCGDRWLNRFKTRHTISLHSISGESASVDETVVTNWYPIL